MLSQSRQAQPLTAIETFVAVDGSDSRWVCTGPEAEIARLKDNLAHIEERRRMEAVRYDDRVRRIEAELEQSRAESVLLSRLCEERDSLVSSLRAALSEAHAERDTLQRELAESRQQQQQRTSQPRVGVMRQHSRPSPSNKAERPGVTVAPSFPKRGTSQPPPDRIPRGGVARMEDTLFQNPREGVALSGSPSAAIAAAVAAATAAAGGPRPTELAHTGGRGVPASARSVVNKNRLGSLDEEKRAPEEMPVEICISVPRALSPDEIMELNEQAQMDEPPEPPRPHQVARMFSSRSPAQSQTQQPRMAVSRQVSAPCHSASSNAVDQLSNDASRWVNAAPPPPVRIVASPQPAVQKPGSATIPTASGIGPVAFVNANASMPTSGSVVPSASSQARLGFSYRR